MTVGHIGFHKQNPDCWLTTDHVFFYLGIIENRFNIQSTLDLFSDITWHILKLKFFMYFKAFLTDRSNTFNDDFDKGVLQSILRSIDFGRPQGDDSPSENVYGMCINLIFGVCCSAYFGRFATWKSPFGCMWRRLDCTWQISLTVGRSVPARKAPIKHENVLSSVTTRVLFDSDGHGQSNRLNMFILMTIIIWYTSATHGPHKCTQFCYRSCFDSANQQISVDVWGPIVMGSYIITFFVENDICCMYVTLVRIPIWPPW